MIKSMSEMSYEQKKLIVDKEAVDETQFEWIIIDNNNILASKKPGEDPIFIDAEKAVLYMIEAYKSMEVARKNALNMMSDLSRLIT
jgi:hypothetical protein